ASVFDGKRSVRQRSAGTCKFFAFVVAELTLHVFVNRVYTLGKQDNRLRVGRSIDKRDLFDDQVFQPVRHSIISDELEVHQSSGHTSHCSMSIAAATTSSFISCTITGGTKLPRLIITPWNGKSVFVLSRTAPIFASCATTSHLE